jgi:hypothetical protein
MYVNGRCRLQWDACVFLSLYNIAITFQTSVYNIQVQPDKADNSQVSDYRHVGTGLNG